MRGGMGNLVRFYYFTIDGGLATPKSSVVGGTPNVSIAATWTVDAAPIPPPRGEAFRKAAPASPSRANTHAAYR